MEADLLQFIQTNPSYAYICVFGVLLLCGLGLPMPEDIVLVTGGYMVYLADKQHLGAPTLTLMLIVGLVGVLSGDITLFFAGRKLGPRVTRVWPFRLMITPRRMQRVQYFFDRYGATTAFFARFAAGLRAPTYLLAGTAGMRFRTFILADGSAALLSVPAWILLAWHFGAEIDRVKNWMAQSKWAIVLILALLFIYVIYRVIRARRRRSKEAARHMRDLATDHSATDHSATDHSATDHSATDHSATDHSAT
ncbi:MAG: DedA family protein [Deltaproteobacteria bacterium]|nr:DedA family protein [Deltaproteobacteria bacterium]